MTQVSDKHTGISCRSRVWSLLLCFGQAQHKLASNWSTSYWTLRVAFDVCYLPKAVIVLSSLTLKAARATFAKVEDGVEEANLSGQRTGRHGLPCASGRPSGHPVVRIFLRLTRVVWGLSASSPTPVCVSCCFVYQYGAELVDVHSTRLVHTIGERQASLGAEAWMDLLSSMSAKTPRLALLIAISAIAAFCAGITIVSSLAVASDTPTTGRFWRLSFLSGWAHYMLWRCVWHTSRTFHITSRFPQCSLCCCQYQRTSSASWSTFPFWLDQCVRWVWSVWSDPASWCTIKFCTWIEDRLHLSVSIASPTTCRAGRQTLLRCAALVGTLPYSVPSYRRH